GEKDRDDGERWAGDPDEPRGGHAGLTLVVTRRCDGLGLEEWTRDEVDTAVRAVAVRLCAGVTAAAELDLLALGDGDDVAVGVFDSDRTGHDVGTVRLQPDASTHAQPLIVIREPDSLLAGKPLVAQLFS